MATGIELVTGHTGEPHVTAAQDARRNAGIVGTGRCVLATGDQLRCVVDSANQVTILTGDAILNGRHVSVEAPVPLALSSGAQMANRNDLVCVHYEMDQQTGVESAELVVVEGTASSGSATDPSVTQDSPLSGGVTETWWPIWRIPITGVNVGTPVRLADVVPATVALGGRVAALEGTVSPLPAGVSSLQSRASTLEGKVSALQAKANAVGTTLSSSKSVKITAAGIDRYTNGPSVSCPAGTWVFVGNWGFGEASSDGDRNLQVGFRSGASGNLWGERERVMAAAKNFAALNVAAIRTLSATTTVYLAGSSSKTTKDAATCYITATRIK